MPKTGQVSFHNVRTAHGSGPNTTGDRRMSLSVSLHALPTPSKPLSEWDSASLVRELINTTTSNTVRGRESLLTVAPLNFTS